MKPSVQLSAPLALMYPGVAQETLSRMLQAENVHRNLLFCRNPRDLLLPLSKLSLSSHNRTIDKTALCLSEAPLGLKQLCVANIMKIHLTVTMQQYEPARCLRYTQDLD